MSDPGPRWVANPAIEFAGGLFCVEFDGNTRTSADGVTWTDPEEDDR